MRLFLGLSIACLSLSSYAQAASYPPTVLTSDSEIIATGCTDPVCYDSMSGNTGSGGVASTAISYAYTYPGGATIAGSGASSALLSANGGPQIGLQIQSQANQGTGQSGSPAITSRADASLTDILTETSGPTTGYFLVTFSLSGNTASTFSGSIVSSPQSELTVDVSDYSNIIPLNSAGGVSSNNDLSFAGNTEIRFNQGSPSYLDLSLSGAVGCQSIAGETGPGSCNEMLDLTTLSITAFQVLDLKGNVASATVGSASGFDYQSLSSAPEPRFEILLGIFPALLFIATKRQLRR